MTLKLQTESKSDFWINRLYFVILPIILGITLVGLYTSLQTNRQNTEIIEQIKVVADQTKTAIEENQSIAKQNRSYSRCIAQIFAKYTRDDVPIRILDLDTCTTDSQTKATNDTKTGGTAPGDSPSTEPTPAPNSSQPSQPSQPQNPPPDNRSNLERAVDLVNPVDDIGRAIDRL